MCIGNSVSSLCSDFTGSDPRKYPENREQLAALEQQNEEQRIANKELERILSDGTEEEYIERIAREQLGFAYPEEQVLVDISGS